MEQGKVETEEERYTRRHERYVKSREERKNYAFHKDSNGNKVKSRSRSLSDMSEEEQIRYREMRHKSYLKARELNKPYVNTRKEKEISDEEREKRRVYASEYRKTHPDKSKNDMKKWRAKHGEEEKRSWQEYRRNNKKLSIEYLGGKCVKCGGVFHPDVYDFHHKDINEKDICVARLLVRKFDVIKTELDKCILLCANCHRIEHAQY